MPSSVDELAELLDRLENYEMYEKQLISSRAISNLFQDLSDLYEETTEAEMEDGYEIDEDLPVKVKDLVAVYSHIAQMDQSENLEFRRRN